MMPSYTTDMENGHFGNVADGNANTSEFPLHFGDMLDTGDGALHHQIYEFFQGPAPRQRRQLGNFQEGCFPFPPYPETGSANSLAASFHYLPEETLQAATTNSVEQRIPDNGPHLSQLPQVANHHGSHVQRKQSKAAGSAAGHMLPTTMGSCIPRHLCSMDDTGNFGRATFQYAPAKSSLVYTTPDSSAYIPIPSEFSGYETSCSPNNLKRSADCEMRSSQPRHRGKSQKVTLSVPDHSVLKSNRPTDQAEHIIRERLRRDDMTSKFQMLETLLPPGPKRDRGTIVEDSIQYVKNLHHRLKDLQQKRAEMKSSRSTSFSGGLTTDKLKQKMGPLLDQKQVHAPAPCNLTTNPSLKKSSSRPGNKVLDNLVPSPSESNDIALAKTSIEKVQVHLDLPHEIVIEMTCRPHGHIQSQILEALEQLRMDVSRCSISKLHGRIMCSIVVKPRVMTDPPITSNDVIRALKQATVAQVDL